MKLRTKFLAALLPTGLIAAGAVLYLARRSVHRVVLGGLERSTILMAETAAPEAAPDLAARREARLLAVLHRLQKRQGAVYAALLDPEGRVVAHTSLAEKGTRPDDAFTRAALASASPSARATDYRGEAVLEAAVPVWSPASRPSNESFLLSGESRPGRVRLGTLKVGVSLAPEMDVEAGIARGTLGIVAATAALSLAMLLLLVNRILKPVGGLLAGIARVAAGRYDVRVPVSTRDELGDLAESFNDMSARLERTTVSKEYVEGILENMPDLLLVASPDGDIETVNPAAMAALSYRAADLVGRPLETIFLQEPRDAQGRGWRERAADGRLVDVETALRTSDGRGLPVLFSAAPLRDRGGRERGYVAVAKDMTERLRAERALRAAKASAEASSRELEAFSYSVAHDLRAPLRAIDGFSKIVLDDYGGVLDENGRRYLERVRHGSTQMGQLIDDLLNLSRISRSALKREKVDLSALARDVAADLQRAQPGRAVEFAIAAGLEDSGDPSLLRAVLGNLLGNAWKYTSKHARARIELGAEPRPGGRVYFVRDDGAGFSMEFAKNLFKPFSRLHAAGEFEGTGIGLATVQRVIERHGGRVWARAAVERGATFYFTLWEDGGAAASAASMSDL